MSFWTSFVLLDRANIEACVKELKCRCLILQKDTAHCKYCPGWMDEYWAAETGNPTPGGGEDTTPPPGGEVVTPLTGLPQRGGRVKGRCGLREEWTKHRASATACSREQSSQLCFCYNIATSPSPRLQEGRESKEGRWRWTVTNTDELMRPGAGAKIEGQVQEKHDVQYKPCWLLNCIYCVYVV